MQLIPENWQDIKRYYLGTYVKFKEHGDELFHISHVSPEAVKGTYQQGKEEFILSLDSSVPYNLEFKLPHKAVFQYRDRALMLFRVPARQYYRGISPENTKIINAMTGEPLELTWATLSAFVNKQAYYSLKEAMELSTKKRMQSMALNNRMCYVPEHRRILLDNKVIAFVEPTIGKIKTPPVFIEDVRKLVAQNPFPMEVVSV